MVKNINKNLLKYYTKNPFSARKCNVCSKHNLRKFTFTVYNTNSLRENYKICDKSHQYQKVGNQYLHKPTS